MKAWTNLNWCSMSYSWQNANTPCTVEDKDAVKWTSEKLSHVVRRHSLFLPALSFALRVCHLCLLKNVLIVRISLWLQSKDVRFEDNWPFCFSNPEHFDPRIFKAVLCSEHCYKKVLFTCSSEDFLKKGSLKSLLSLDKFLLLFLSLFLTKRLSGKRLN